MGDLRYMGTMLGYWCGVYCNTAGCDILMQTVRLAPVCLPRNVAYSLANEAKEKSLIRPIDMIRPTPLSSQS